VSDGGELLLPVFILHESTVKATFNTPPCEGFSLCVYSSNLWRITNFTAAYSGDQWLFAGGFVVVIVITKLLYAGPG